MTLLTEGLQVKPKSKPEKDNQAGEGGCREGGRRTRLKGLHRAAAALMGVRSPSSPRYFVKMLAPRLHPAANSRLLGYLARTCATTFLRKTICACPL